MTAARQSATCAFADLVRLPQLETVSHLSVEDGSKTVISCGPIILVKPVNSSLYVDGSRPTAFGFDFVSAASGPIPELGRCSGID